MPGMALPPNALAMALLVAMAALVLAAAIVALVGADWWGLGDTSTGSDRWRADVSSLARELETAVRALEAPIDPDRLQRTVLPMAGQFRRKAREAPADVDGTLVRRVYDLGMACQRLGVEQATHRLLLDAQSVEDVAADLAERAGRIADDARVVTDDPRS